MRRHSFFIALILILAFAVPVTATAADDPPGPTTRHLFRTPGLAAAGPMEVVKFVFELPPGAATPPHTHPGLTLGTVIQGEVTFEAGGVTSVYKVGDTIVERPSDPFGVARNATAATTLVAVSMVVPQGAAPSTAQQNAPAPAIAPITRYLYRTPAVIPAGQYEVIHQVLDFAPGAATPVHTHPGQVIGTVLAGENTFTYQGVTTVYKVGDSFVELPGVAAIARNAGTTPLVVYAVFLLPQGVPLSAPVTPAPPPTGGGGNLPGLPNTGAGGGNDPLSSGWLLLGFSGALALWWGLRCKQRSA